MSGSRLRLTDGGFGEAASAFTTSSVDASQFVTSFSFQLSNPNADGFTFTLQANDPGQLGAGGGGLGYQGIGNSICGILGVLSVCLWFCSIPLNLAALIMGFLSLKSPNRGMALAGTILGAIGLVITVGLTIVGVIIQMNNPNLGR